MQEQKTNMLNYANSMCRVNSTKTQSDQCTENKRQYKCYRVIWEVHHGDTHTIFAVVYDDQRFRFNNSAAQARSKEYKVKQH
jgi:hypothetical protein